MTWWDSLDEYLAEREKSEAVAPDPWAAVDLGEPTLTDEQVAFLADQPAVPRLLGLTPPSLEDGSLDDGPSEDGTGAEPSGDGTGNSPGDG
jgi:hypothetical protein